MKIALFQIHNPLACHYSLFGYRETLQRMGHKVLDCSFPSNTVENVASARQIMPTISDLNECDVILSAYHEYTQPWLKAIYSEVDWARLRIPVIARYDESMDRGDLGLPNRVPELMKWAQFHFWPAVQDAEKYGGTFLPYGADTTIFYPDSVPKRFDIGFIGTLYPKRHEYLTKLQPHCHIKTNINVGNVQVHDLSGLRERESTLLLADNYRAIKIFFCFPPMSNLLVEKIFDVMACDTFVMYPRFAGAAGKNMALFEDKKHIVYYDLGFFADNGEQLKYYFEHPDETQKIARAGGSFVREKYTLEGMLKTMLAVVGK